MQLATVSVQTLSPLLLRAQAVSAMDFPALGSLCHYRATGGGLSHIWRGKFVREGQVLVWAHPGAPDLGPSSLGAQEAREGVSCCLSRGRGPLREERILEHKSNEV